MDCSVGMHQVVWPKKRGQGAFYLLMTKNLLKNRHPRQKIVSEIWLRLAHLSKPNIYLFMKQLQFWKFNFDKPRVNKIVDLIIC